MPALSSGLTRSPARVVRLTTGSAFVSFTLWRKGQILVAVDPIVLQQALGLSRDRLLGAQATAVIWTEAVLDSEVGPTAWRPVTACPAQAA
jgi:hypothetical protein